MKKIIINGQFYDGKSVTGIGNYVYSLISGLNKYSSDNEYTVFCHNPNFNSLKPNIKILNSPSHHENFLNRFIWENFFLRIYVNKHKPNIFYSTSYNLPFFLNNKVVKIVTIHDVMWRKMKLISYLSYLIAKFQVGYSCKNADYIITPSEATKNDLIELFKCNPKKIFVVYNGNNVNKFNIIIDGPKSKILKQKYNLPEKFLFWIGSIKKNKNLVNACKAFLKVSPFYPQVKFVIAGNKSNNFSEIESFTKLPQIMYVGKIEEDELPLFYNKSIGLFFPSFYEGFGYPIVESLLCGKPVITSNTSSMVELNNNSKLQVDPNDIESIENGLRSFYQSFYNVISTRNRTLLRKYGLRFSDKIFITKILNLLSEAE
jgi:glycosyltransferase involved in cell wall biosynthesis